MPIETVVLAAGPGDFENADALVATTADIATPAGAQVILAHVFTDERYEEQVSHLDYDSVDDADPNDVVARHTGVQSVHDALADAGLDVDVQGRVGDPGAEIVALVDEVDADLVVVGGRKRTPTGKAVFGSTAQGILLDAPAPVTFVKRE